MDVNILMPAGASEVAGITLATSLLTMCCAKSRCYRLQHRDGESSGGCGFTNHSLFDDPSTEIKVQKINGIDIAYVTKGQGGEQEDDED